MSGRNSRQSSALTRWMVARMTAIRTTRRSRSSSASVAAGTRSRDHSAVYGFSGTCACRPTRCSTASRTGISERRSSSWRSSVARLRARRLRTSALTALILAVRVHNRGGRHLHLASHPARAGAHAPRELVLRRGDPQARAGADLPACLAVRWRRGRRRRARPVPHLPGRRRPDRRRARPRRRAARLRQRLPPPRAPRGRGVRSPRDAPVPVPRVDVRPRRVAAHRAARGSRAGLRRRGLSLHPVLVDTWGPLVFVNPDPSAAPLADTLGDLPAGARRRRPRPVDARVPRAQPRPGDRSELEDRRRELPRVLPLPRRPSELQQADRRRSRRLSARHEPLVVEPVRAGQRAHTRATARRFPTSPSERSARASSTSCGRTGR